MLCVYLFHHPGLAASYPAYPAGCNRLTMSQPVLDALRRCATSVLARAHVPFSERPVAAVLLLADGTWVPGVRVESASFPLTIPALASAYYTARSAARADIIAAVQTTPLSADAPHFLSAALGSTWTLAAPDALCTTPDVLQPTALLTPLVSAPEPLSDQDGLARTRTAAASAHVPASDFPVGCVAETEDGQLVAGANVEHPDWTRGLCAERVVLATACSYGVGPIRRIFLTCLRSPHATPCGACRQLLAELAPNASLVLDRGDDAPEIQTPSALLPHAFSSVSLRA